MEETSAFPKRQSNSTSIRRTVTTHHIWTGFEDEVRHFNAYYNPLCRGWGGRGGGRGGGGGGDRYEKREIFWMDHFHKAK